MGITADEARCLTKLGGDRVAEILERFEEDIEHEARNGRSSCLLAYTDCGPDSVAAIERLRRRGFRVRTRRESVGGVLQHPAYYAEW